MATTRGAGLMIAPALLSQLSVQNDHSMHTASAAGSNAGLAIGLHTLSMLVMMAGTAWIVYRKLGLMVLKKGWINFDLIWSAALLLVGCIALVMVAL